ncbi:unnamed protein product [Coffea canephora]|uniref:Coiled-coil SMC6 And NSE5 INteracting (CANIN) domain-containing protein n=1 Tax=Coffea canephora TaxID=49390 RepID=A0A068UFH3_COFCA|nr:unnamed protein product [Coffea canephora]
MEDIGDYLDFEFEEPSKVPAAITKKKKKVIGLDDLVADYYQEKSKVIERESKRAKSEKQICDSDDDLDEEDARQVKEFEDHVDEFQKDMGQISNDDDTHFWGFQVFGNQEVLSPVRFAEIDSCELLQSFQNHKLNSMVELEMEKGETFLEGLLTNGWLLKLVFISGQLEDSIATWTFNLMLYSSKDVLRRSACDLWCSILLHKNKPDHSSIKLVRVPSHSELKKALEVYGFQLDSSSKSSSDVEMVPADSDCPGPPQNIQYWIKYVRVCFQVRNTWQILSSSEAEDLTYIIITMFLDRVMLGLSVVLHECLVAAISYFKDDEWQASCHQIAKCLALRLPTDVNCLRIVDSISAIDGRSKHLRSAVAFQFLVKCFDAKVLDAEEILRLLISINVRDNKCNLFKMYIGLSLAENWLLFDPLLNDKPILREMWGLCLRNCSCQITSTDLRPFASKVRCKATYLLQGTSSR